MAFEHKAKHNGRGDVTRALPLTITAPVGGLKARGQEETERGKDGAQEHTHLNTSTSLGNSTKDRDNASVGQPRQHSNKPLLHPHGAREGNMLLRFFLVSLLVIFLFLYVVIEIDLSRGSPLR